MGFFNGIQEKMAVNIYENQIQKYLKEKDGKIHTIMILSFSKIGNVAFSTEDKYTTQMDYIIDRMQSEGYEIVDIKFNVVEKRDVIFNNDGIYTLITYK